MNKFFIIKTFILAFALLTSCKDKMICPAFQSTYILEEDASKQLFSLFGEDSLPKSKVWIQKNRYGMIVKVKHKKRLDDFRTVKMKTIYPDSKIDTVGVDEESFANQDNDTLQLEASTGANVRYNSDQYSYMKYIGDDIAKAYERKQAEYNKGKKEKEEKEALEPAKSDRKTRREEKRKKKQESKEPKPTEEEEEEDE
ncbi:MAG: hypothetical protein M3512_16970, partial [Bacteroidota bacterium]|nr:hypothetical protein [Bacteroidota bacterium]